VVSPRTLHAALAGQLTAAEIPDADFDAKCMIEQVTGRKFYDMMPLSDAQAEQARAMADRRVTGEPLQYILGEWEFYGLRLFVGEGVLIPRPDTETLVDAILERISRNAAPVILDLCSGSGCIALALRENLPHAQVHAVEKSDKALLYLRKNAAYHGGRITIHQHDVLDVHAADGFSGADVIVSNPPYLTAEEMAELQTEVRHEPAMALEGGGDGLLFYREIPKIWKKSLRPGGVLAFEVGDAQAEDVAAILAENGFADIRILPDLAGISRVVLGIFPE